MAKRGSGVEFISRTSDMRFPKLSEIEVGMTVYIMQESDAKTVYIDTIRARINQVLPSRFYSEKRGEWTDRALETQEEYEQGYLSWVRFLVKNKRLLIK